MSWHAGAAIRKLPGAWVYSTGGNQKAKTLTVKCKGVDTRTMQGKLANSINHALKLFSI